jgi:hypothetical protein
MAIDHFVMAVTSPAARSWHPPNRRCTSVFQAKTNGERVMIDAFAMAFVALALGFAAVIGATMLGSKL